MSDYGLTEAQITELIQRHIAQTGRDKSTEYALPSEILENLEESFSKELRIHTQKFTKEALQSDEGKWTKSGVINKMSAQELKNTKTNAYQSIQQRFKDGDRLRVAARGATEVFEEKQSRLSTCLCGGDLNMANIILVADGIEAQQDGTPSFHPEEELLSNRVTVIRMYQEKEWMDEAAAKFLAQAIRKSTNNAYNRHWKTEQIGVFQRIPGEAQRSMILAYFGNGRTPAKWI
ncbi:hypothetical protein RMATCC62417_16799 [Rhizopus microsporus]|nr:hypothetical protein RMATCC62417_16799 [Rhizopus microsporus]